MFRQLLCLFIGHRINRNRVWHDGLDFRTRCQRCKVPMLREDKGWVKFNPARHGSDRPSKAHHSPI
jgi:hypothetical protein